jgi:hypothetical protein
MLMAAPNIQIGARHVLTGIEAISAQNESSLLLVSRVKPGFLGWGFGWRGPAWAG